MDKHGILIVGSGKIGLACAGLLAETGDYKVYLNDLRKPNNAPEIPNNPIEFVIGDINTPNEIVTLIKTKQIKAVISCLPFHLTYAVAKIASECGIDYFDPTEDVAAERQRHAPLHAPGHSGFRTKTQAQDAAIRRRRASA